MIKTNVFIALFLLLTHCTSTSDEHQKKALSINDFVFDGPLGSEGAEIEQVGNNHFKITLSHAPKHENWANNTQFVIYENAKGNKLTLDVSFPHEKPKYLFNNNFVSWSYDMEHWNPVEWMYRPEKSLNNDRLVFPMFERDTVYVGYQVPLSYEKLEEYLNRWDKNPFVHVHVIGKSTEDKNIYRLELNDGSESVGEPWVHYFSNQHAGEHNSQWRMIGMVNYLLGEGRDYLKKSIHHFIFLSSPDAPKHGWYRVNREGRDLNREYLNSGSDSIKQSREGYLIQRDFEQLMNSKNPPHTAWAMHTWVGPVEIWMNPGPEVGTKIGNWKEFKEIMIQNDPDSLIEPIQNRPSTANGSWGNGPNAQFGITNFLCEGGRDFYTKDKNLNSGAIIMKSITQYYK